MTLPSRVLNDDDRRLIEEVGRRRKGESLNDLWGAGSQLLVATAAELGLRLDWQRLNRIVRAFGPRDGTARFVPPEIVEVCRGLARHRSRPFKLALDPFARDGALLAALVSEGIAMAGAGRNAENSALALAVTEGLPIEMKLSPAPVPDPVDPGLGYSAEFEAGDDELTLDLMDLEGCDDSEGSLDLVVCCPPWGDARHREGRGLAYREWPHQLFFEAHRQLMFLGGAAVFLMPSSFFLSPEAKRLLASAADEGDFRVEAAFHLPSGALPGVSCAAYVVVATAGLSRILGAEDEGRLFVAELDGNKERTAIVLENLFEGRPGATLSLGRLVDASSFSGFPILVAREELLSIQRTHPGQFFYLREVVTAIRPADKESANAKTLFIRKNEPTGLSATCDITEIRGALSSWIALDVELERAEPEYLARWLETSMGRIARRSVSAGASMSWVALDTVGDVPVHVPPLEEQRERLRLLARARQLESLGRSASERACLPGVSPDELRASLTPDHAGGGATSIDDWSESLPFPLASILRRVRRESQDPERSAGALLHFFEAFGEFWATILLSALEQVGEIPGPATAEIRREIEQQKISPLERSSMGTWLFVGGKIAKWFRTRVLDQKEGPSNAALDPLRCLATRDSHVLTALLSGQVPTILTRTVRLRNDSRGHGGAVSVAAANLQLDRLRNELAQLREVVAPAFDALKLYRVGDARIGRGVRNYAVEVLQGSNAAFLRERLELEDEPPTGALVLSAGAGRSLQLVPLIRMAAPQGADNACYFYNRTENGTARFVSYHQGDRAEDLDPAPLEFLHRWCQEADGSNSG